MCKLCVFSGTSEGRRLIECLCGRGAEIVACVATEYGEALTGAHPGVRVHAGRMGAEEMRAFLLREGVDIAIDATHPYAVNATENIARACAEAKVLCLRLNRASDARERDGAFVADVPACVQYLKDTQGNVLLTTGSKELPAFCAEDTLKPRLYARVLPMIHSLEICAGLNISPDHIIAMQGPFDEEMNRATFKAINAKYMVTKDSGSLGGYEAKIRAAKALGVKTVVIGRPPQDTGYSFAEVLRRVEEGFSLRAARKKVTLAGVGMGNPETRTLGLERALRDADLLIGSKRMLESVNAFGKPTREVIAPDEIRRVIDEEPESKAIVVLLSGDTGFYSGAKKLADALWAYAVEIIPGIGSLQYFCARMGRSWENVRAISMHGRDLDFVREVREHRCVFALLGGENGAKNALETLKNAQMGTLRAYVGECLGYPGENISSGTVQELASGEYDPLSVLFVENEEYDREIITHGLPDEVFERDETPMTKSEIRAISISKLQLTRSAVMYDIGSGSGSVAVEAAIQAPEGRVYAIEMKERAAALTRRNAEKFHLTNISVINASAPEALEPLPAPTHAFIGGSTGSLREIIDCLLKKNPGVQIVANAVTLETISELSQIARAFEFCDIAEVSVAKPREVGRYRLMSANNPVYIFSMRQRAQL